MFIKKDTRKIPDILNDENDEREELHLGRRYVLSRYLFRASSAARPTTNGVVAR